MRGAVRAPKAVAWACAALWIAAATPACAQQLYWLDSNYGAPALHRANADGSGVTNLALTPATYPEALTMDRSTGKLYWTEAAYTGARLMTAPATLFAATPIATGLSCLRGITIDSGSLYWTSSNLVTGPTVSKSTLAGTGIQMLFSPGSTSNPRALAINAGKVYYADFDQNAIMSANLDGTGITLLAPGSGPYGLVVDPVANKIYWTNYTGGTIQRCNLNGSQITTFYAGLSNPTYLAIDASGGSLYWIEAAPGGQRMQKAPITPGAITTVPVPVTSYGGLVYAPLGTNDVGPPPATVHETRLAPIAPNPTTGATGIDFSLAADMPARLSVLDVQGRTVAALADGPMTAGPHHVTWSGADARGPLPAGLYFVSLQAAGRSWVRRVVLER
jgi:hypothetical protein